VIAFHNGAQAMARSLATYIPCARRIKREVESTFDVIMSIEQITAYRATYLRQQAEAKRHANERIDYAQTKRDERYAFKMFLSSKALALAGLSLGGHQ